MKITYLVDNAIDNDSGVMQKVLQQSSVWIKQGHIVYYISLNTLSVYNSDKKLIKQLEVPSINFGKLGTALKLLYCSYFLDKLLKYIDFDILYTRYMLYMPFLTKVIKRYNTIMEINGDDTIEYSLYSKLTHFYNKYTRNIILRRLDGLVCVSYELENKFKYFGLDTTVISNGINLSELNIKKGENQKPILVFIGTPNQPWQGLEKIIKMSRQLPEFKFYIIGTEGKNTKNLEFFGYLSKNESVDIIKKADIGIGTLSSYLNGLEEASPLKTRQYLACGLPIIYAYLDTDLKGNEEFTLKFDNCEDNIDVIAIKKFVNKVFNNKEISSKAFEFAKNNLDYNIKEQKRLEFFKKFLYEK